MITSLSLQNFKGIRDQVRIELNPITLLFGANSSGKSTILQAIHYAREILERNNVDADRTFNGGEAIDLGGFQNLVYSRDKRLPIVLRFDLDLSTTDLPEYTNNPLWSISKDVQTAWVELTIAVGGYKQQPFLKSYTIGLNERGVAKIENFDDVRCSLTYDLFHPLVFGDDFDPEGSQKEGSWSELQVIGSLTSLPQWGMSLEIEQSEGFLGYTGFSTDWFNCLISQIVVGPGEILRDLLRGFRYVGPIRKIPPRAYQPISTQNESRWADGTAAWDLLYRNDPYFLKEVNSWISDEDKLNTGYRLFLKFYKELDLGHPLFLTLSQGRAFDDLDVQTEIERIPIQKRLVLIEQLKELEVSPQDIGVGISQILPVVVAALDPEANVVAIEQPELHVHPAIQVSLGDLFISQIKKGKLFLIETHSEHLILRLLRRIREVNEGEVEEEDSRALKSNQVSVLYLEQQQAGVKITNLRIDETGEFIDQWPKGFFEERAEELF